MGAEFYSNTPLEIAVFDERTFADTEKLRALLRSQVQIIQILTATCGVGECAHHYVTVIYKKVVQQ